MEVRFGDFGEAGGVSVAVMDRRLWEIRGAYLTPKIHEYSLKPGTRR
jgi:hypothetical protein